MSGSKKSLSLQAQGQFSLEHWVLPDGRLVHGGFVQALFLRFERVVIRISKVASHTLWARAGSTGGHTGPYGLNMGPLGPGLGPRIRRNHLHSLRVSPKMQSSCFV